MNNNTIDMTAESISPFIAAYRDSLKNAYDSGVANLNQQRDTAQTQIMSNANTAGLLYSNFPARSKIQYDTSTYYPALTELRTTYQTGLDSLRNTGVSLANNIKAYQEAIADLSAA